MHPCYGLCSLWRQVVAQTNFCVCMRGFWRPDGAINMPCQLCPEGADCPGGTHPPVPRTGHWAKYEGDSLAGYPQQCAADPQGCSSPLQMVFGCSAGDVACAGGLGAPCQAAWDGAMCSYCADNHFAIAGECHICPDQPYGAVMAVFAFLVVVLIWIAINMLTAGSHNSLDIGLQYMQYVATVQVFSVDWGNTLTVLAKVGAK